MQQLPVHRAGHAGSGGNIGSAYGIFLQLAAHHHVGPGRRRGMPILPRDVAAGLEKTTKERSQKREDQEGQENIDDEITQHGGGAEKQRSPPAVLTDSAYFFFLGAGALGFLYAVSTLASMEASMPLAESANWPAGASSRYFWNACTVPSTGVTLPSAANDALPIR